MNERDPMQIDEMNSQLDKARLWKKKMSIIEPSSVYHDDNQEVVVRELNSEVGRESVIIDQSPKERNVSMRETFKQRAQQRQREIDQLNMMLITHQHEHMSFQSDVSPLEESFRGVETNKPNLQNQEPFDFDKMEKQKEIDSRFYQFSSTHKKLNKKPTRLLRAHLADIEENCKLRFQPSCKSRRVQSESGSLSLISKTPKQLERILASLDEQSKSNQLTVPKSNTIIPTEDHPMIGQEVFPSRPSYRAIINHPHQIDFEEESFDHGKSFEIQRIANSTIQFSQWKSVFSKNNK